MDDIRIDADVGDGSMLSKKGFFSFDRARLIQDQAPARNVDSRNHSSRFDCCVFLFHILPAVTFSTASVIRDWSLPDEIYSMSAMLRKRPALDLRLRVAMGHEETFARSVYGPIALVRPISQTLDLVC